MALETRNAAEPKKSGYHTSCCACAADSPVNSAASVRARSSSMTTSLSAP